MATAEGEAAAAAAIAAFAVAKGGVVLKNIFLNAPPPEGAGAEEKEDPPVMFGRHPDCHVLVDHPSVSRFHLEVRSRRRHRRITVTDLSSVHGTWVSGRRIPPHTPVELVAGDTLRLGGSKREYRLHWLSLHEAFDMEDLLPPLIEEDREEFRTCQEASKQLVPGQESVDTDAHQETSQQAVSEQIDFLAKVIPSAPPMPEFSHFFPLEESSLSQFDENIEGVVHENLVDENPIIDSFGSSITQAMPATVTDARRPVQSDKKDDSSAMSWRAKLKSVKSLRIDTGRSKGKISALSYSYQKEETQNENLICYQNCGIECAACMVLSNNSYVKEAEEEKMIAGKDHMNSHVSDNITMEGNQEGPKSLDSKEFVHYVSPLNPEYETFSYKENSKLSVAKETEQNEFISVNSILQDSAVAKPQKVSEMLHSISPLVSKDDRFTYREIVQLGATVHLELSEPISENPFMQDIVGENVNSNKDMTHDGLPPLNLDGNLSSNENFAQSKIVVAPEFESTICGSLFNNLDIKGSQQNEESSPLDKENTTPYVSGDILMERNELRLKPIISQELMDSISPLDLEHDNISDDENSMLNIGKQMKSNELISKNPTSIISVDAKLQKSQTEFMPISHLDFEDDTFPDKENSVLSPGMYDVRLEDLFPANDDVTPASRNFKSIGRNIVGSRMDSSLSAEYTSKRRNHKRESNELSAKSKDDDAISPVRPGDLFPDKENVTPASRDLKPIGRKVLGSRIDSSLSAEYTSNRRIHKQESNELSAKSKDFHTVDDDAFYSDKENLTPISSGVMKARRCLPMSLTMDADQDQEAFYSDKENLTPVSSATRKTRVMSENRARIESAITKKRVVDRLPFQTLLSNSPLRHTSSLDCTQANVRAADVAIKLEDVLNNIPHKSQEPDGAKEGMKAWNMVTDTDCLLDEEFRRSIMLLKGLKGTQLIIPRIVIRELDCMKQREGLFRRSSKATSILQWIEECMEKESWWIHVQSSSEMLPVAPTPPVTPTTQINEEERLAGAGTFNPVAFFSPRSFADIVSPKTEDRILDCALLFNKLRSNQNMVILSNSITLKIKAMAEGLPCEGAKEFQETLMNPCSSRFMWAASTPRGSAWSCLDETALEENYYNSHHGGGARRMVPRSMEAAKGLKLILLHNSLYANSAEKRPLAPMASW